MLPTDKDEPWLRKVRSESGTSDGVVALRHHMPASEEEAMSTMMIEDTALTTADRCDRCGAQAYYRITLNNGGELLFCAHHAHMHEDKLKQVALHIQDESAKLH